MRGEEEISRSVDALAREPEVIVDRLAVEAGALLVEWRVRRVGVVADGLVDRVVTLEEDAMEVRVPYTR